MPTETDGPKKNMPQRVITNDPTVDAGNTAPSADFVGERVDLPSAPAGKVVYPTSPAGAGYVIVRPITTKEEEILATERFWRMGTALDMVMSRCIVTKGINTLDLISGDRAHILFFLRTISYGPKYSFETVMKNGNKQTIETDVSKLKIKALDAGFQEPFIIQLDGVTYEARLSRGFNEQAVIQARLRSRKKDGKNATEPGPTENLKQVIVSVNGDNDPDVISKHVDTMIAGRAHKLRAAIAKYAPGPSMELDVTNEESGELETVAFQMTEAFFRPDSDVD